MSTLLVFSSFVTTVLIPEEAFEEGGEANGRALAYLAHDLLGDGLGTIYDISSITILWSAGASALAGLLNVVPRFLPRYGMAPEWACASRPLVIVFTAVCFLVTILFRADVDAQAGAYATGVLAMITSATVAVTLAARRSGQQRAMAWFGIVAGIFIYTITLPIVTDPTGLFIALVFIGAIVVISLVSRACRSTELRAGDVILDAAAIEFVRAAAHKGRLRIIANHPDDRTEREYLLKEREELEASNIPVGDNVLFLEVTVTDASEFAPVVYVSGEEIRRFWVLQARGASIPNTIAAVLIEVRDLTGCRPHVYFGWTEGNPLKYLARFILFGEGSSEKAISRRLLTECCDARSLIPSVGLRST